MTQHHIHDAVIVGGGHNGLVTAAYLARAGLDVVVLERRHALGGAVSTEELWPGHLISSCSYILHLLQDRVVDDLDLRGHGLEILNLDPKRFSPFPDGTSILFRASREATAQEIAKISEHDAQGYLEWEAFWDRAGALLNRYFLNPHPPTVQELRTQLAGTEDGVLFDRLLNGTLTELLDEYFESEYVKAALGNLVHPPISPDEPGVLMGCAATTPGRFLNPRNQGLPVGGMGAVSEAIARSAQAAGASIRVGAEVRQLLVTDGRAEGVELVDGQRVYARVVISNADPKRTFGQLLHPDDVPEPTTDRVQKLRTDYSTLKFHAVVSELPDFTRWLGVDHDPKQLAHIGICPSVEYLRASAADAAAGRPTSSPLIAMQIPTVYDKTLAPEGHHIVSMWVRYAPTSPAGTSWDAIREREGRRLIDVVTSYAPNFESSIIDWLLYTPADIERRVGMTDGNIHHLSHLGDQMLGDRGFGDGGYRTPIDGLYLCGAGTHPGGEVSGAPGYNAAQVILSEQFAAPVSAQGSASAARALGNGV